MQSESRRANEGAAVNAQAYAAPERRGGEGAGVASMASDAYSAAAVVCHVASGRAPAADGRPPEVPETVPEPLRSALRGALCGAAAQRTGVAEMLDAARRSRWVGVGMCVYMCRCVCVGVHTWEVRRDQVGCQCVVRGRRRAPVQTCCICMEEEDALTACSAGAHRMCGECLGSLVGTLADNPRALRADGDVGCRESTGRECGGAFPCREVVEALVRLQAAGACVAFVHAVRRHAATSAEAGAGAEAPAETGAATSGSGAEASLADHRRALEDALIVVRCPGCRRPGDVDVGSCMALYCAPGEGGCGSHFCGWCMAACPDSDAAHAHVEGCGLNPNRPHLYASGRDLQENVRWEQRLRVVERLRERVGMRDAEVVWDALATLPTIRELGLRWEDVRAHMDGVVVVRTGDELVEAAKRGGWWSWAGARWC